MMCENELSLITEILPSSVGQNFLNNNLVKKIMKHNTFQLY